MEFTFSPEQEALREAVRSTLAAEAPMAFVRRMIDDERGFTDDVWQKLAGLSWLGLLVPEAQGGLGLGLVDAFDKSAYKNNTIVVLWGDHGWHLGEKDHWRKFALWEEATRMPYIWIVVAFMVLMYIFPGMALWLPDYWSKL